MNDVGQDQNIEFIIDKENLYREESFTDLKVGSIRRLVPVKPDGTDDPGRTPIFVGNTQLMSPDGPMPIQSKLSANTIEEAMDVFPEAMKQALGELVDRIQKMRQQQQQQQQGQQNDDSRIIMPGR
ncbi:MAG: cytoplasmic protein [Deltaproteobacteria bacterium]|nr:cytoplasmic protein [Deltaproteobacteria bacterium]